MRCDQKELRQKNRALFEESKVNGWVVPGGGDKVDSQGGKLPSKHVG